MTYRKLAEHWKVTEQAARQRVRRGKFQKRTNNLGAAEYLLDLDAPIPEPRGKAREGRSGTFTPADTPNTESPLRATLEALEGHVATLKEQLAKAEALAADRSKEVALERERVADLTSQILRLTSELIEARKVETPAPRSWWQRLTG
jgi:uncharacterized coiled-coil protein SlyX